MEVFMAFCQAAYVDEISFNLIKQDGVLVGFNIVNKPNASQEVQDFCLNFGSLVYNNKVKFVLNENKQGGFITIYNPKKMGKSLIKFQISKDDFKELKIFWNSDNIVDQRTFSSEGICGFEVVISNKAISDSQEMKISANDIAA